jgi:hypothetical protein
VPEPAVEALVHRAENACDDGGPEDGVGEGLQQVKKGHRPDYQDRQENILSDFLHFHDNLPDRPRFHIIPEHRIELK